MQKPKKFLNINYMLGKNQLSKQRLISRQPCMFYFALILRCLSKFPSLASEGFTNTHKNEVASGRTGRGHELVLQCNALHALCLARRPLTFLAAFLCLLGFDFDCSIGPFLLHRSSWLTHAFWILLHCLFGSFCGWFFLCSFRHCAQDALCGGEPSLQAWPTRRWWQKEAETLCWSILTNKFLLLNYLVSKSTLSYPCRWGRFFNPRRNADRSKLWVSLKTENMPQKS